MKKEFYFSLLLTFKPRVKLLKSKCDYVGLEYGKANQMYPIGQNEDLWYIKTEEGSLSSLNDCLLILKKLNVTTLSLFKFDIAKALNVDSLTTFQLIRIIKDTQDGTLNFNLLMKLCELGIDCFNLIEKGYAVEE